MAQMPYFRETRGLGRRPCTVLTSSAGLRPVRLSKQPPPQSVRQAANIAMAFLLALEASERCETG